MAAATPASTVAASAPGAVSMLALSASLASFEALMTRYRMKMLPGACRSRRSCMRCAAAAAAASKMDVIVMLPTGTPNAAASAAISAACAAELDLSAAADGPVIVKPTDTPTVTVTVDAKGEELDVIVWLTEAVTELLALVGTGDALADTEEENVAADDAEALPDGVAALELVAVALAAAADTEEENVAADDAEALLDGSDELVAGGVASIALEGDAVGGIVGEVVPVLTLVIVIDNDASDVCELVCACCDAVLLAMLLAVALDDALVELLLAPDSEAKLERV